MEKLSLKQRLELFYGGTERSERCLVFDTSAVLHYEGITRKSGGSEGIWSLDCLIGHIIFPSKIYSEISIFYRNGKISDRARSFMDCSFDISFGKLLVESTSLSYLVLKECLDEAAKKISGISYPDRQVVLYALLLTIDGYKENSIKKTAILTLDSHIIDASNAILISPMGLQYKDVLHTFNMKDYNLP